MPSLKPLHAAALAAIVALLALLPLAFVTVPPMVDYPNHLARCAILAQLPSSAALRAMYEPRGELLPNLAMDAVVVPLAHVMSPFAAGKVFCALVILGTLGGGVALSYALYRRLTLWSFAPALLLYHHILIYGFVNYLFGLALMLFGLAAWIGMRRGKPLARIAVGALFATALFLSHLIALFLFGLAVAGYELARWIDAPDRSLRSFGRAVAGVAATFVLPVGLLALSPTHAEASEYHASTLGDKVDMLVGILRTDGNRLDALFSVVVLLAAVGLVWTGAVRVARPLRYAVLAVVGAFLLLPDMFATCACVDVRIPIAFCLLLAAGTQVSLAPRSAGFSPPSAPGRPSGGRAAVARLCLAALALAFLGRSFQITRDWRLAEAGSHSVLADLSNLPDRSTVFLAADDDEPIFNEKAWSPPLVHLAVAEAAERPLFFPQIFALPRQHPLAVRPELRKLEAFQDTEPFPFDDHEDLQGVLDNVHEEASSLTAVPPSLGSDPAFYLFVLTQPSKPLDGDWKNAQLLVRRPRYALFRITNLETAARARRRYWDAQKKRHEAMRVARS